MSRNSIIEIVIVISLLINISLVAIAIIGGDSNIAVTTSKPLDNSKPWIEDISIPVKGCWVDRKASIIHIEGRRFIIYVFRDCAVTTELLPDPKPKAEAEDGL